MSATGVEDTGYTAAEWREVARSLSFNALPYVAEFLRHYGLPAGPQDCIRLLVIDRANLGRHTRQMNDDVASCLAALAAAVRREGGGL